MYVIGFKLHRCTTAGIPLSGISSDFGVSYLESNKQFVCHRSIIATKIKATQMLDQVVNLNIRLPVVNCSELIPFERNPFKKVVYVSMDLFISRLVL